MVKTQTAKEITERGIMFTGDSIEAILEGRKTQTRRVVKVRCDDAIVDLFHDDYADKGVWNFDTKNFHNKAVKCAFGKKGDSLFIKEYLYATQDGTFYKLDNQPVTVPPETETVFRENLPPMVMPKWAARFFLKITNIRVERLQEITAADVKREGFPDLMTEESHLPHFEQFETAWDSINSKREGCSWKDNPFVWVIEFKKI